MEIYIVTETNTEDNLVLRSWVCPTEEKAKACLQWRYNVAVTYNNIAGKKDPTDCLEYGFFFWEMTDGPRLRYNIVKSQTFEG